MHLHSWYYRISNPCGGSLLVNASAVNERKITNEWEECRPSFSDSFHFFLSSGWAKKQTQKHQMALISSTHSYLVFHIKILLKQKNQYIIRKILKDTSLCFQQCFLLHSVQYITASCTSFLFLIQTSHKCLSPPGWYLGKSSTTTSNTSL